ncbi:hypothetical protein VXL71_17365 [Phaeobacter sp. JH20_31]
MKSEFSDRVSGRFSDPFATHQMAFSDNRAPLRRGLRAVGCPVPSAVS